jgi:hypothetical protein
MIALTAASSFRAAAVRYEAQQRNRERETEVVRVRFMARGRVLMPVIGRLVGVS